MSAGPHNEHEDGAAAPVEAPPAVEAWRPRYEGDEVALGIALAVALHALPLAALAVSAAFPAPPKAEEPPVARPMVAATLLKLGKPVDPKKLPDRLVPQERTMAKRPDIVASQEEPLKRLDAGVPPTPPPPNARETDLDKLIAKSDPFAEDAGKARPEEGHAAGIDGGTETDPNKVKAGDQYGALLGAFFHERWQYPTVISQGEANKLCVVFRVRINQKMVIWYVQQSPSRGSGNELFDDSARTMLQKLLDDHTPLPEPPAEVSELYRGRALELALQGNAHGDGSRCR